MACSGLRPCTCTDSGFFGCWECGASRPAGPRTGRTTRQRLKCRRKTLAKRRATQAKATKLIATGKRRRLPVAQAPVAQVAQLPARGVPWPTRARGGSMPTARRVRKKLAREMGPPPRSTGASIACGSNTCSPTQFCVHPCCGGAPPACLPNPNPDGGTCPHGPCTFVGPNAACNNLANCCAAAPCTPPAPYCADKNPVGCLLQGRICLLTCA